MDTAQESYKFQFWPIQTSPSQTTTKLAKTNKKNSIIVWPFSNSTQIFKIKFDMWEILVKILGQTIYVNLIFKYA